MTDTTTTAFRFHLPPVCITIGRMDWVVERCQGKMVLHLGCVDAGLTKQRFENAELMHSRLTEVCRELWGIDSCREGIEFLQSMGIKNLIEGDVEQLNELQGLKTKQFDIILASEIIEHLKNPVAFLENVRGLFSENTEMIITVPNCYWLTGIGNMLRRYEVIHPEHKYWFSFRTLVSLIDSSGYQINEVLVYSYLNYRLSLISRLSGVFRPHYQKKRAGQQKYKTLSPSQNRNILPKIVDKAGILGSVVLRRVLYRINPFFADGIIVVITPKRQS